MISYFKELERVQTKEYVDWLINFTKNRPNKTWSDEEFAYNKKISNEEKNNIYSLGFFLSFVDSKRKEQNISCERNDIDDFEEEIIYFKLKNEFYKISIIFGQGAVCEISQVDQEIEKYVELSYESFV